MCPVTGGDCSVGKGSPHRSVLAAKGLHPTGSLAQPPSPPGSPALPCTAPRTGRDSTGKPMHLQEPRQVALPPSLGQRCFMVSPVLHPTADTLHPKSEKEENPLDPFADPQLPDKLLKPQIPCCNEEEERAE